MLKKLLKKKSKFPTTSVPRTTEELQKAYGEYCAKAGQVQYQIAVLSKELARINKELEELNYEGAARQQLDAKLPKNESVGEVKNA